MPCQSAFSKRDLAARVMFWNSAKYDSNPLSMVRANALAFPPDPRNLPGRSKIYSGMTELPSQLAHTTQPAIVICGLALPVLVHFLSAAESGTARCPDPSTTASATCSADNTPSTPAVPPSPPTDALIIRVATACGHRTDTLMPSSPWVMARDSAKPIARAWSWNRRHHPSGSAAPLRKRY